MYFKSSMMRMVWKKDGDSDTPAPGSIEALIASEENSNFSGSFGGGDDDDLEDADEEEEEEDSEDADDEDDLDSDDDDNDSDNADDAGGDADDDEDDTGVSALDAVTEQIANLTNIVTGLVNKDAEAEGGEADDVEEDSPLEGDAFSELSDAMDWDEDQQKVMKEFLTKLDNHSKKTILAKTLKDMPNLVNKTVTQKTQQEEIYDSFYTENSALKEVKPYVSQVANTILKEHKAAGKKIDAVKILKLAAERSYKALGIKKVKAETNKGNKSGTGKKPPAFPKGSGARKRQSSKKKSRDESMIAGIMSLDN